MHPLPVGVYLVGKSTALFQFDELNRAVGVAEDFIDPPGVSTRIQQPGDEKHHEKSQKNEASSTHHHKPTLYRSSQIPDLK